MRNFYRPYHDRKLKWLHEQRDRLGVKDKSQRKDTSVTELKKKNGSISASGRWVSYRSDIKVLDWDKYNLNTPIYETPEFTLNHLRKGISHYNVRRFKQTHPGLSERSQDEIDEIRNGFRMNLIGEEVLSER